MWKKRIVVILCVAFLLFASAFKFSTIRFKADEPEVEQEEEVIEEEVPQEETDEIPTDIPEEEKNEFEEFKQHIEEYLATYFEQSLVSKVITWAIDAGVLSALFFVYRKYSKYKHTTIEDMIKMFKEEMEKWLKEKADELTVEQVDTIKKSIETLEESNETIMKVLVLMQDNTAKGKAALIEYLGSKTNSKEVKEAVSNVQEKLEEKEKVEEEIKDKVKDDYIKLY